MKIEAISPILPDQRSNYTIVGKMLDGNSERFFFSSHGNPESIINYITGMSKGPNKVHAIYEMDISGNTQEMTIGFENGRLGLIKKYKEEVNNWNK